MPLIPSYINALYLLQLPLILIILLKMFISQLRVHTYGCCSKNGEEKNMSSLSFHFLSALWLADLTSRTKTLK